MLGPYINGVALLVGSVAGAMLGPRLGRSIRSTMPMVFGCAAMGLGVVMTVKVRFLAPVVLALILGALFGELVQLENAIRTLAGKTRVVLERLVRPREGVGQEEFLEKIVALLVLFCVSGTGVYGAMSEGMTGDPTLLIVKSILDLFTAVIFAASLGISVAVLVIPQFLVQATLYSASSLVMPLMTPEMTADFSACGGIIMLATGFRICDIKPFPVGNMIPALFIVMPLSWLWAQYMG